MGIGANYDPGQWFVMGEIGRQKTHAFIGDQTAWYVTGGYRVGSFTPYATYSHLKTTSNTSDPGINPAAVPPFLIGPAIGLSAVLNSFLRPTDEHTISVGTRWDFAKNMDLKLQYDRIYLGNNSTGTLRNVDAANFNGGNFNVISVAVDFVF